MAVTADTPLSVQPHGFCPQAPQSVPGLSLASGTCSAHYRAGPSAGESTPPRLAVALNPRWMGVGGSHPLAVITLSTSSSVSQSSPVCGTLRCPESEPTGEQPPLASFPSFSNFLTPLPLPTSTAHSLGIRTQIYVTPKAQILPQHRADNLPSEAESEARHCRVLFSEHAGPRANSLSTGAAFLAFRTCFLHSDSRPRCLAVYPKSRRVFVL